MRLNGSEITINLSELRGNREGVRVFQKQNLQSYTALYKKNIQRKWHGTVIEFKMQMSRSNNSSVDSYQKVFVTDSEVNRQNRGRKSLLIVIDLKECVLSAKHVFSQQPKVNFINKLMSNKNKYNTRKVIKNDFCAENEMDTSPKCLYRTNNSINNYVS